eukprot:CAMPEP_0201132032 /NCGR_PEP_ID=MMETSP0850-20130426/44584_1 /ASSEMBLY_ACC=CAM_ASM_000622 /TAXON_ID=183588 /ORGANISM="Pseudo-nitzschia fraudulenta, Strain WWA7" /LENGTH=677 /DNA_ID=CAMNT_0047402251 /DNA_START=94 /DNA_END=2127 /DNA_ORIENTATION=+
MYSKLPIVMMNKTDYTEIAEDHPGAYGKGQDSVGTSAAVARERRSRNRFWDAGSFVRSWSLMKILSLGMVLLLAGIVFVQGVHEQKVEAEVEEEHRAEERLRQNQARIRASHDDRYTPFVFEKSRDVPLPPGVNIGSWLSLEDYFFAGLHNSVEVATPGQREDASKVAACLPPLHVGSTTGPKWHSETDLFRGLVERHGAKHAIEVFQAHRSSFFDLETDLERIASLGIRTVRVPVSWCFTDHDPRTTDLSSYESDEDLLEDFACVDPFFDGGDGDGSFDDTRVLWPAVPRAMVEDLLRACATVGIKASIDVHTLPGGTSIGTFSGVWPHWPRFWTHGGDGVGSDGDTWSANRTTNGWGIGHDLFRDLVAWMEDLSVRDPLAFGGLRGLSPMNEPAHLAGLYDPAVNSVEENFLPPLPADTAGDYLAGVAGSEKGGGSHMPDGTHLRVFHWFDRSLEIFRSSKLPALGIEFQACIIESIFEELAETDKADEILRYEAIGAWWSSPSATSAEERSDWAVLDIHHYHSWSTDCSGTTDGQDAAYACGDKKHRGEVLRYCARWATEFREIFDRVCGGSGIPQKPPKLMSGEFSASSHHSVRRSCTDLGGLRESYTLQVEAAAVAGVEAFYWSYKMPYGGSFGKAGWSFSELMYNLGVIDRPDVATFECDANAFDDPEIPH